MAHRPALPPDVDVLIAGGGPAGAAAALLLARWGHRVCLLAKPLDRRRGQAESIPPSATKLLSTIGVLDAVEHAGFYRSSGNTVWWATRDQRLESFDPKGEHQGYQVFRPDFDHILLQAARAAGVDVQMGASARGVDFAQDRATLEVERDHMTTRMSARMMLDATGRAGVVARKGFRRHERQLRMQALMGIWHCETGWPVPDDTHTLVETFEDGWAWSVPVSRVTRHIGVMVSGVASQLPPPRRIRDVYRGLLERVVQMRALATRATCLHAWACDASIYSADLYGSREFLLVGDAASTIDPLSSFGIKKALASAWMAAVTTHTALTYPDRRGVALDYYSSWERQVFTTHLRQTRDFAIAACAQHPRPFWAARAALDIDAVATRTPDAVATADPAFMQALERLTSPATLRFARSIDVPVERRPLVRDREIVLAEAVPLRQAGLALRFLHGVDLVHLRDLACEHPHVADLHAAYCRHQPPVSLRHLLSGLSVLVANGVLQLSAADSR